MSSKTVAARLTRIALAAALYIGLTLAGAPLAYGAIQFRFSEILVLLCFYRRDYCYAMVVGCAIVNLFSPLGLWDALFGTLATLSAVCCIRWVKSLLVASFFPTLFCIIIGLELYFLTGAPLLITTLTVMLGEFVVVTLAGFPLFKLLERNQTFLKVIKADPRFLK